MNNSGKKLAIMQPYFLPYIGYFQLMAAVDKFVVLDDVAYINRGWVNRNRILINGDASLFTIPLRKSSQNKLISEIEISNEFRWQDKLLRTIKQNYHKTNNFQEVYPLVTRIVNFAAINLSQFLLNSLQEMTLYLDISVNMVSSSGVYGNSDMKGQSRIVDICLKENAGVYINPPGGVGLYEEKEFERNGIDLLFLKPDSLFYCQNDHPFVEWLSIIDVLMFNSKKNVIKYLQQYKFLKAREVLV